MSNEVNKKRVKIINWRGNVFIFDRNLHLKPIKSIAYIYSRVLYFIPEILATLSVIRFVLFSISEPLRRLLMRNCKKLICFYFVFVAREQKINREIERERATASMLNNDA